MPKLATRLFAAMLLSCGAAAQIGCNACGSCHDYSRPVANCQCNGCTDCGSGRAGSASARYYAENELQQPGDTLDQAVEIAQQPMMDEAPLRR